MIRFSFFPPARGGGVRRAQSGFSLGPFVATMAFVLIILLWNRVEPTPPRMEGGFTVFREVELVENGGNDGDSFRIRHEGGSVEVFRLYFVDTCEKSARFPRRLDHQGEYFGGLGRDRVLRLGDEARETVLDWLRREPFEVYTRRERVMESDRLYAMIRFPEASADGDSWLAQRLVRAGLARIYTRGTALPDGTPEAGFKRELGVLESEAKRAQRGAWRFQTNGAK